MTTELLTTKEAAAALRVMPQTMRLWRHTGRGPAFVRYSTERGPALYRMADIEAWLDSRRRTSTSDESARAATA